MGYAMLSNDCYFTIFSFGGKTIRFKSPFSLERYTEIKEWDNGYIVAMARYQHNTEPEEEYIDLIPILENLYIDAKEFLAPIKGVIVACD